MQIAGLDPQYEIAFLAMMNDYKRAIGEPPLGEGAQAALLNAVQAGHIRFFLAVEDGEPVGMCSLTRTFSTFNCTFGGVFEDFFVRPDFRGKGAARKLVNAVQFACKEDGISSLWVGCADCDAEMYRALGFDVSLGNLLAWVGA